MAKRFKLRICRVITTTLQSCRSKDPSILPEDPVPSFSKLNPQDQNHLRPSSVKHHLSSAIISIGTCGNLPPKQHDGTVPQEFKWQKEKKWHVVAKIYDHRTPRRKTYTSDEEDDENLSFAPPPTPPPSSAEKKKRPHRRNKRRVSKRTKRGVLRPPPQELEIPARLSVFKKLIPCTVDGKVKESFAIVKRSEDPYEDFKNSMMDMILEKQMFDRKDLEQLLQCFLSLNSRNYHGIIVEAFSEIWEAIFSPGGLKPVSVKNHGGRRVSRPVSF